MGKIYLNGMEFMSTKNLERISFAENDTIPDYVKSIRPLLSADAEATFECEINAPLFSTLTGVDLSSHAPMEELTLECKAPYLVQIRRHKKKRINKKWAKRYGYKTMFKSVRITNAQITPCDNGMDFEFIGRGPNVQIY